MTDTILIVLKEEDAQKITRLESYGISNLEKTLIHSIGKILDRMELDVLRKNTEICKTPIDEKERERKRRDKRKELNMPED